MKAAQKFTLAIGIAYVLIGTIGFIPALVSQPESLEPVVRQYGIASQYGYALGLFPVNAPLNVIHITVGVFGIVAAISLDSARFLSGQIGIYFSLLGLLGLIPVANTFFGLFPLFGMDVLLHGITGLLGIYFGFFATPSLLKLFKRELEEDATAAEVL